MLVCGTEHTTKRQERKEKLEEEQQLAGSPCGLPFVQKSKETAASQAPRRAAPCDPVPVPPLPSPPLPGGLCARHSRAPRDRRDREEADAHHVGLPRRPRMHQGIQGGGGAGRAGQAAGGTRFLEDELRVLYFKTDHQLTKTTRNFVSMRSLKDTHAIVNLGADGYGVCCTGRAHHPSTRGSL